MKRNGVNGQAVSVEDIKRQELLAKAKKNKEKFRIYFSKYWLLYAMLFPTVVYLLIFNYYPMLGLQLAFKDWKMKEGLWGSPWATNEDGTLFLFKNFYVLMSDHTFWQKFGNTLRISSLRLIFGFPMPIMLVIFLNELTSERYKKIIQSISYLPHFISWIIISGIIISMTESGTGFQNIMKAIFGKELYFFTDNNLFIVMLVVSSIWKSCGWGTIIYFAAITGIGQELYEAATVDGANRWQKIRFITLPGILPAITITLILNLSNIVYGGFDQVFNMYNTAVYDKGDILETYLYRIGVSGGEYALGTAVGLFNSLIALVLTLVANYSVRLIGGEGIW